MTATALSFFAARESEMAAALLRQSRAQFETAAAEHAHAFWADRVDIDLPDIAEPDVRLLRNDPRVQQAFEWLKAQPVVRLRAGAGVKREPQPVVRGRHIVMEQRLVTDEAPRGFRFLRDVDAIELSALAPGHDQVPALFEAYNRRHPPVALPDFLGALSVMLAFGILEQAPDSSVGNALGTLGT
jgi:hypothetical protein